MKSMRTWMAGTALVAGALGFCGVAQAGNVYWSVGVGVPGVTVGFGSVPPVVYAPPIYALPVYAPPPPVYVVPATYYAPPPRVIHRPAPVHYYGRPGHGRYVAPRGPRHHRR